MPRPPARETNGKATAGHVRALDAIFGRLTDVPEEWLTPEETTTEADDAKQTVADRLMKIADEAEFWHTPDDVAFATIQHNDHSEHYPVRSRPFKQWLKKRFFEQTQKVAGSQTVQDVVEILEGRAMFDGETFDAPIRVAEFDGRTYIDLCDDEWRAIEIDSDGWRIVTNPPVRFRRSKAMLPLTTPERGGSIETLRQFVNVTDSDWPLVVAFLLVCFRPKGCYWILKIIAEQGSGKTTLTKILRRIVDPNAAPVRSAPSGERDLMIVAKNGWLLTLDNLSFIKGDFSDCLCRLSTGGAFSTRTLYADDEETIFNVKRPTVLNGIDDIGLRPDLLDRSLVIELPRIDSKKRKSEIGFWEDFEQELPGILGAILDAVSTGIRRLPEVEAQTTERPRMADAKMFAIASEYSWGEGGDFSAAYDLNQSTAVLTSLESCPVFVRLEERLSLKIEPKLEKTATELLTSLEAGLGNKKPKGWPGSPRVLSGMLKRMAPSLRAVGIIAEQVTKGRGKKKRKVWSISREEPPDEAGSQPGAIG